VPRSAAGALLRSDLDKLLNARRQGRLVLCRYNGDAVVVVEAAQVLNGWTRSPNQHVALDRHESGRCDQEAGVLLRRGSARGGCGQIDA
jgi:hypothetical protein